MQQQQLAGTQQKYPAGSREFPPPTLPRATLGAPGTNAGMETSCANLSFAPTVIKVVRIFCQKSPLSSLLGGWDDTSVNGFDSWCGFRSNYGGHNDGYSGYWQGRAECPG